MNYLAQVDIPSTFGSPLGQTKGINDIVSLILKSSFVLAGLVVLFFFIIAGFQMISSAGQENPEKSAKAKQAITGALTGFIIIFVAYWIIRIIELITGVNFITSPNL
jgi:uncharacterized membrane protein